MYSNIIKPLIDFIAALLGLILLSPIFIIVWLGLSIVNKGKPFFFQDRGGKDEVIFSIIKFKTMNDKKNGDGKLLSDEERLTSLGKFVRKTSLDELPQLINVLKGDMSLIGPRPFISDYLSIYTEYERQRHEVKPGITGWAQVNGRNNLTWKKKFELDVWYVKNQSFLLDLKILFLTVFKLFKTSDVNKEGQKTTVRYDGNN